MSKTSKKPKEIGDDMYKPDQCLKYFPRHAYTDFEK